MSVQILIGDARDRLRELPDNSVHCCVSSPPYFGLRDYGVDGQMGLESTPDEFVAGMVALFREVRRVLRDDGVLFLNLGDSYAAAGVLSQSFRLREDLTDDQRTAAAVAMFGLRFDGHDEARQRAVPEMLSGDVHRQTICNQSSLASGRVQGQLSEEPDESLSANAGSTPGSEVGGAGSLGRQMRLLRGDGSGVPHCGSHQRGRIGAPQGSDGQEQGQLDQGLSGHSEARFSERSVSGSLLQLQLRNRLVGILSSQSYADDQIPAAAKAYFRRASDLKPKDLIGIPWRVAFALQADGWWLRQDIIWSKPNPMPESVRDRCTKAHEYLFLLSKGPRYYYDAEAIAEQSCKGDAGSSFAEGKTAIHQLGRASGRPQTRRAAELAEQHGLTDEHIAAIRAVGVTDTGKAQHTQDGFGKNDPKVIALAAEAKVALGGYYREFLISDRRNKRSVWEVATQPYSEAHFATYPPALIEPCILAGCPKGGIVLDPFFGAGTTGLVADRLGRDCIGIELNPEYAALAERRIQSDAGLFAEVQAA